MSKTYNTKQYMLDLLSVLKNPDQQSALKGIIESIPDDSYRKADDKYRARKYPDKDLSFYMTGRCTSYLESLSPDAFQILHYLATYMSQDNLCIAPTKTIAEIFDTPVRSVERAVKELRDSGAITDTGKYYHRSKIYEVDQDYLSYGTRPVGKRIINGRFVPVVTKVFVESEDPENPKVLYVGDIQEIQPKPVRGKNVVDYKKPKATKPMTTEQLLEGLI